MILGLPSAALDPTLGLPAPAPAATPAIAAPPRGDPTALREADFEAWMLRHGMGPKTIESRLRFVRARHREWGTLVLSGDDLALWLNKYRGWTKHTYTHHLHALYAWLVEAGRIDASPLVDDRPKASLRRRPSPLNDAQLEQVLLDAYARWDPTSTASEGHLYAWLQLGHLQGLRRFEMAKFQGSHINQTSLFVLGKGNVEADLPTHPHMWEIAQQYPRRGHWFRSPQFRYREHMSEDTITLAVGDLFRRNGIEVGNVHRLRHTYGTNLARNGVDVYTVRDLMRHSSIATTEVYIELASRNLDNGIRTLGIGYHLPMGDAA